MFKKLFKIGLLALVMIGQAVQTEAQPQDSSSVVWIHDVGGGEYYILYAKFFPDEEKILLVKKDYHNSKNDGVYVLSVETGEVLEKLEGLIPSWRMIFSKDGRYVYNQNQKYDLLEHKVVATTQGISNVDIAIDPNKDSAYSVTHHGPSYWSGRMDSNLVILKASTLETIEVRTIDAKMDRIEISPDGKYIITYEFDTGCCYGMPYGWPTKPQTDWTKLILRNPDNLEVEKEIARSDRMPSIWNLTFSPDSKMFATHGTTYPDHFRIDTIYIWSTEDWKPIGNFYVRGSWNSDILFSCNSKYLFTKYSNQEKAGIVVYSVKPPFEQIYKQDWFSKVYDISCAKNYLLVDAKAQTYRIALLTIPEFITDAKPADEPEQEDIVYPNPTSGDVRISFHKELIEPVQVTIANSIGTVIYTTNLEAGTKYFQWNTLTLPSGMYLCTVRNKNMFKTYKIMVSK